MREHKKDGNVKGTLMIMVLAAGLLATRASAGEPPVLKTDRDKINYCIGVDLVRNFKKQGMEVDLDRVFQGMKDANSDGKLQMTEEDLRKTMLTYQTEHRQKQARARQAAAPAGVKPVKPSN